MATVKALSALLSWGLYSKPREKKKLVDRKGKGREIEKQELSKSNEIVEEKRQAMPSPKAIIEATTPKVRS